MPKPREDVQRGALFHSTPEGPIHRGTITQAILVRNPILPFGHENTDRDNGVGLFVVGVGLFLVRGGLFSSPTQT